MNKILITEGRETLRDALEARPMDMDELFEDYGRRLCLAVAKIFHREEWEVEFELVDGHAPLSMTGETCWLTDLAESAWQEACHYAEW